MDKNSKTNETAPQDSVSIKRRKLLKTAATTAPVIATLQSGAAFANTSAYQCINDATKELDIKETVKDPVPLGDNWVRKQVKRYKFKDSGGTITENWWYDIDGVFGVSSGPYYRVSDDGTLKQGDFPASDWSVAAEQTVHVIVYFEPDATNTSVVEVGVYPKYYVAQPYDNTQLPLNGSCLASMA
jgi:hypothetical protein